MSAASGFSSTGDLASSTSKSRAPEEMAREKLLMIKAIMRMGKANWFKYSMNMASPPGVKSPRITSHPPYHSINPRATVK